jgi:hypothetical protein
MGPFKEQYKLTETILVETRTFGLLDTLKIVFCNAKFLQVLFENCHLVNRNEKVLVVINTL